MVEEKDNIENEETTDEKDLNEVEQDDSQEESNDPLMEEVKEEMQEAEREEKEHEEVFEQAAIDKERDDSESVEEQLGAKDGRGIHRHRKRSRSH